MRLGCTTNLKAFIFSAAFLCEFMLQNPHHFLFLEHKYNGTIWFNWLRRTDIIAIITTMIWVSALNKVWADLQSEYIDYICKFSGTLGKIMIFLKPSMLLSNSWHWDRLFHEILQKLHHLDFFVKTSIITHLTRQLIRRHSEILVGWIHTEH